MNKIILPILISAIVLVQSACKIRSSDFLATQDRDLPLFIGANYSIIPLPHNRRLQSKFLVKRKEINIYEFQQLATSPQPYQCIRDHGFEYMGERLRDYLIQKPKLRESYMLYRTIAAKKRLQNVWSNFDGSPISLKKLSDLALEERFTPTSFEALQLLAQLFLDIGDFFLSHIYAQAAYHESIGLDLKTTQSSLAFIIHLYAVSDFKKQGLPQINATQLALELNQKHPWSITFASQEMSVEEYIQAQTTITKNQGYLSFRSPNKNELKDALRFSTPVPNAYFDVYEFYKLTQNERNELVDSCANMPDNFKNAFFKLFGLIPNYLKNTPVDKSRIWDEATEEAKSGSLNNDPLFSAESYLFQNFYLNQGHYTSNSKFMKKIQIIIDQRRNHAPLSAIFERLMYSAPEIATEMFMTLYKSNKLVVNADYCFWGFQVLNHLIRYPEKNKTELQLAHTDFYQNFAIPCLNSDHLDTQGLTRAKGILDESFDSAQNKLKSNEVEAFEKTLADTNFSLYFSWLMSRSSNEKDIQGKKIAALNKVLDLAKSNLTEAKSSLYGLLMNEKRMLKFKAPIKLSTVYSIERMMDDKIIKQFNRLPQLLEIPLAIGYLKNLAGNPAEYSKMIDVAFSAVDNTPSGDNKMFRQGNFVMTPELKSMIFASFSTNPDRALKFIKYKLERQYALPRSYEGYNKYQATYRQISGTDFLRELGTHLLNEKQTLLKEFTK